jgi:hypothetical protein
LQRNGKKRALNLKVKRIRWGNTTGKKFFSQLFRPKAKSLPKASDMGFPQRAFCGVFELLFLRNAQKRH